MVTPRTVSARSAHLVETSEPARPSGQPARKKSSRIFGRPGSTLEPDATGGSSVIGVIGNGGAGRWSIGELARSTGMTVRALRHYDEIGLLEPGERSPAGRRRYTEADLRRLYRIRALRGLGLALDEIGRVLDGEGGDLRAVLAAQLRELEARADRLHLLRDQVRRLLDTPSPGPDDFLTTLELMSMFETYFTERQRDELAARRDTMGPEAVEAAKHEWAALVTEGLALVAQGVPVDDPRAVDLLDRWDGVGTRFHGDDPALMRQARALWSDNRAEVNRRLPWPAEDFDALVDYLDRARTSR